jgi:multidrug resistance efflux pump
MSSGKIIRAEGGVAMDELTGIALGHVNRLGRQAVSYAQEIDRANGEIDKANAIIANKNQIIADLQARIAELELQVKLAQATDEADQKLLAEWRTLHPQSPLRQAVGKLKDGRPLTKGFAIWAAEFDRVAKKLGITNPEAYRIS